MRFSPQNFVEHNFDRKVFFWPAVLAAGISASSSLVNQSLANKSSSGSSRSWDDMLYDVNMTRAQWAHDEYMANTAHQREVNDLRQAGLNPILSATGGNGAPATSTPVIQSNSAAASVSARQQAKTQQLQAGLQIFSDMLNAGLKDRELDIAGKNADSQLMNAITQSRQTDSNTALQNAQIANYAYQNENLSSQDKLNLARAQEANARINFMNMQGNALSYQNSLNSALATEADSRTRLNLVNSSQIGKYGPHIYSRTAGTFLENLLPSQLSDQSLKGYGSSILNGVKSWFDSLNSAKSTNQATKRYLR